MQFCVDCVYVIKEKLVLIAFQGRLGLSHLLIADKYDRFKKASAHSPGQA